MEDKPRRVFHERSERPAYKTGLDRKAEILQRRMDSEDVIRRFKERHAPPVVITPEPRGPGAPSKTDRALEEFRKRRASGAALPTARQEAKHLEAWDRDTFTAFPHPTWKTIEKLIAPAYQKDKRGR